MTPDDDSQKTAAERRSEAPSPQLGDDDSGQLDARWFVYPAYVLTFVGGGVAADFAIARDEWSVGPVAAAWTLLFVWYWLYSVAFHYRRPVLKYFSLTAGLTLAGLLTAFCADRIPPQYVATPTQLKLRELVFELVWAAAATGASGALIFVHAMLYGRAQTDESDRLDR